MAFTAKDSTGTAVTFKSTTDTGEEVGHSIVDTLPGTAAEAAALPAKFVVIAADDGVDTHPLQLDASGFLKVILQAGSAAAGSVILGAGTAEVGKLAAGTASIGTVLLGAGTAEVGKLAAGTASIGTVLLGAGTAEVGKLAAGTASIGTVLLGAGTAEVGKLAAGTASIGTVILGAGTAEVGKLAAGTAAIGTVDVDDITMPVALVQLAITMATSATQVASNALESGVTLLAASGNAASVFLGNSASVTTANGFPLEAGKEKFLELDNTSRIFYISANTSDKLHILGS